MSVFKRAGESLKRAWIKDPVIVISFFLGFGAVILPFVSPLTKYTEIINKAMPYTYPVPVRDDGNMPDIPSHPCDKLGPSLEWLKNF